MTDIGHVGLNVDLVSASRLHPIIYTLLICKYATLKEIRDDYSVEEVLDMYEACMVNICNRNLIAESTSKKEAL